MKWQKKLNKKEFKHLKFATHDWPTLEAFKANRKAQKELDPKNEVCFECRHIALKLGLEN